MRHKERNRTPAALAVAVLILGGFALGIATRMRRSYPSGIAFLRRYVVVEQPEEKAGGGGVVLVYWIRAPVRDIKQAVMDVPVDTDWSAMESGDPEGSEPFSRFSESNGEAWYVMAGKVVAPRAFASTPQHRVETVVPGTSGTWTTLRYSPQYQSSISTFWRRVIK